MVKIPLEITSEKIFSVRTVHKTNAFISDECKFSHAETGAYPLYARIIGDQRANFFIVKNGAVKYIRRVDMNAKVLLSDESWSFCIVRNLTAGSIAVVQGGQYWSARKDPSRICLNPDNFSWERFYLDEINSIELDEMNVAIIVPGEVFVEDALARLNKNRVKIAAIFSIDGDIKEKTALPVRSFNELDKFLLEGKECRWMIYGFFDSHNLISRLEHQGIARDSIDDITPMTMIPEWCANMKSALEKDYDFIALGNDATAAAVNINRIVNQTGINLASYDQNLRQSLLLTRKILNEGRKPKFILLGLNPNSFFAEIGSNFRYIFSYGSIEEQVSGAYLNDQINAEVLADPNLSVFKRNVEHGYTIEEITKTEHLSIESLEKNLQALEDFIQLCIEHDVKPVGVILPSSPDIDISDCTIKFLRRTLRNFERTFNFTCIDLSDMPLDYGHFSSVDRLNAKGSEYFSDVLNWKMNELNILPLENMRLLSYERIFGLRQFLTANEYNDMLSRIFDTAIEKIKSKDKIKIGFVGFDSSMWCGDLLYQLFAQSERYEPTIFFNLRADQKHDMVRLVFNKSLELFRSKGMNVTTVTTHEDQIPKQDVLIYLTPYYGHLRRAFRPERLTAETLVTYIPYGFRTTSWNIANFKIHFIAWKLFADSRTWVKLLINNHSIEKSRLVYSGLPKMDQFFNAEPSKFEWKEARPNSTKIIWAPHWSIKGMKNLRLATFQWNYKFMYEYAKTHPETSWVFKPHPNLAYAVVDTGIFPTTEAFEDYLRMWAALPNAKVSAVGYYQDIFETSDGMILDSGSFIAEYQYTHRPMLFLMRKETTFSELGRAIIDANYHVDGKDFDGIKNFIENVLIKKNDTQLETRNKVFDEELNYLKDNGMLASEKIFRTIDDAFQS